MSITLKCLLDNGFVESTGDDLLHVPYGEYVVHVHLPVEDGTVIETLSSVHVKLNPDGSICTTGKCLFSLVDVTNEFGVSTIEVDAERLPEMKVYRSVDPSTML